MAYRQGNRDQVMMFPPRIEELVPENHAVRVYDAFVEGLNFERLDFKMNGLGKVGNPEYDPKSLLKVILFGYSYGERSSRRLERAINDNVIFIWLASGLKPDHATIARFRQRNKKVLKKVFKQCAEVCIKLKLIEGNTLFVDGSKIRANAGIKNSHTKENCKKYLERIENRINEILKECEKADKKEAHLGSFVKLIEELNSIEKIKSSVRKAMAEIEEEDTKEINLTDTDSKKMISRQGIHSSYNTQVVVDEKHGLIVSNDVVNNANDYNQFTRQINAANEILGTNCQNACADAGYSNVSDLKNIVSQGINVIVPNQKQAAHKKKENTEFEKENFQFIETENSYLCPEGHKLKYNHRNKEKGHYRYRINHAKTCLNCQHYGICTSNPNGRSITRLKDEILKNKLAEIYINTKGQDIYRKRKEKIELVFGHIKHNLKATSFLLRGFDGVKAEMGVLSTVFNIRRMITLLGTKKLIEAMALLNDSSLSLKYTPCFIGYYVSFIWHFLINLFSVDTLKAQLNCLKIAPNLA